MADISVRINTMDGETSIVTLPLVPRLGDTVQLEQDGAMATVQSVTWTPADTAAKVAVSIF